MTADSPAIASFPDPCACDAPARASGSSGNAGSAPDCSAADAASGRSAAALVCDCPNALRGSAPDFSAAVSFSGHRTYDGTADSALREVVAEFCTCGARTFLSGMAMGFDLSAAEAVLSCRAAFPCVRLVCVVPFSGQERRYPTADRERYERILAAADERVVLGPVYYAGVYAVRNNYLIDHAATLVAWYDGSPGGTHYTLRRALRRGLEVRNLCPAAPPIPAVRSADPMLF